jgi:DNA primase
MAKGIQEFVDAVSAAIDPKVAYSWGGHQFKESDDRLRGYSPFYDSNSGTGFAVFLDGSNGYAANTWFSSGDGSGGNIFQYLYQLRGGTGKVRGQDFYDLAVELSEAWGVDLPEEFTTKSEEYRNVKLRQQVLEKVYEIAHQHLMSEGQEAARAYLFSRGHSEESIASLQIGLIPSADELAMGLGDLNVTIEQLEAFGVLRSGFKAALQGYITFPWRDENGRALSLYGRYPGKAPGKLPKTMSLASPKNLPVKVKSSPLYLDRAIKAGKIKNLTIVEGVNDAAIAQVYGDESVIAFVSNLPTKEQVETLKSIGAQNITLCLDPDQGGATGTSKTLLTLLRAGFNVSVCPLLPNEQDPDEYLISEGSDAWFSFKGQAFPGLKYLAQELARFDGDKQAELRRLLAGSAVAIEALDAVDFWSIAGLERFNFHGGKEAASEGILAIELSNLPEEKKLEALEALREKLGWKSSHSWKDLVALVQNKIDAESVQSRPGDLFSSIYGKLDLLSILPRALAVPMLEMSENEKKDVMMYFQPLLATIASLIGAKSLLRRGSWKVPAILWTTTIARSGAGKTPAQNAIFQNIRLRQREEDDKYNEKTAEWERAARVFKYRSTQEKSSILENDPDHIGALSLEKAIGEPRQMFLDVATVRATLKVLSTQPEGAGILQSKDELLGLIKGMNAFSKGDDVEQFLECWNGDDKSQILADENKKRRIIRSPRLSLYGGIQPGKLKEAFPDADDANGLMARFLFSVSEVHPDAGNIKADEELSDRFQSTLSRLYTSVENMHLGDVRLSQGADEIFTKFMKISANMESDHEYTNQGYLAAISKSYAQVLRLALVLHHIECAYENRSDSSTLKADTLQRAISLNIYYLNQYRKVQMLSNPEASIEGILLQIQSQAKSRMKKGKSTTAQDIMAGTLGKNASKNGSKLAAADIRKHFQSLAEMGFGEALGEGAKMTFTPFSDQQVANNMRKRALEVDTQELQQLSTCLIVEPEVELVHVYTQVEAPIAEDFVPNFGEGDRVYVLSEEYKDLEFIVLHLSEDNKVSLQEESTGRTIQDLNADRVCLLDEDFGF